MAWRSIFGKRPTVVEPPAEEPTLPAAVMSVLEGLLSEWIVIGRFGRLVRTSANVAGYGLVRKGGITLPEVADMVDGTRSDGQPRMRELFIGGSEQGAPPRAIRVRSSHIDDVHVLLLIDDISNAMRVDAMRRDFVANVSHELKTPIGALLLLADAVQSALDDPDALTRFAERIQLEAQRLSTLVQDLTDLSRLQSEDVTVNAAEVPAARAVAEAIDTVRLLAQAKRIDVFTEVHDDLMIYADEEQLITAIRNLLVNAINYSPSFTKVVVTGVDLGDHVELAVSDEGIGIPVEEQPRIFERFYRTDPARSRETGGTGLGLAIVKHVCTAHGGEVEVTSVPDSGSTFTIRLPKRVAA